MTRRGGLKNNKSPLCRIRAKKGLRQTSDHLFAACLYVPFKSGFFLPLIVRMCIC
jgi:hypothetical protein